jgi:hypothetical protein
VEHEHEDVQCAETDKTDTFIQDPLDTPHDPVIHVTNHRVQSEDKRSYEYETQFHKKYHEIPLVQSENDNRNRCEPHRDNTD